TTVMAVQDRIREHAVLQTLGFSTLRVFGLVLSESVLLSTAGGAIGTGLAVGVLWWSDLAVGSDAITIAFAPSPQLALTGLVVAICAGLVAGVFPAYQAATADVVPSLRQT
ncbi:MAG: FtsX-like permease family protein, partial [Planctomycetes bacterium]|nr:FtsX-like permease family protein [Planctomycetota bacterium]